VDVNKNKMSDLTTLFKAYVKTIKLHNKHISVNETRKIQKDAVMCKARDLKSQITQLRNFLVEKRGELSLNGLIYSNN
jgi:SNARE-complex protein Syntaxin-18 N-terminus